MRTMIITITALVLVIIALAPLQAADVEKRPFPEGTWIHTRTIMVFDSKSMSGDMPVPNVFNAGQQSRDLALPYLRAAHERKLKRLAGTYTFEFQINDANYEALRNLPYSVRIREPNGPDDKEAYEERRFPADFGPKKPWVPVPVINGEGVIKYPVSLESGSWVTDKVAFVMTSPWRRGELVYPPSGSLKTCGPSTASMCMGAAIWQGTVGGAKQELLAPQTKFLTHMLFVK